MKTKHLYIIGGGHAGSSAALSAARFKKDWKADQVELHLIDKHPYMTVKPRLYEYELEEVLTPFHQFLDPIQVHFHQDKIVNINIEEQQITGKNGSYAYDALIIAPGSQVGKVWEAENVDSFEGAKHLQEAWKSRLSSAQKLKMAILGAGFTGIELATEMPINFQKYAKENQIQLPEIQISLISHGEIGAGLGENPKPEIQKALRQAKINCISYTDIKGVKNGIVTYTREGEEVTEQYDLVVNTLGQTPNALMEDLKFEKDRNGRILVDQNLRPQDEKKVFIAGDVASVFVDQKNKALMTCQQGRPQGRYAGYNALATLVQRDLVDYEQPNYVTCLDLGAYGALYTQGWDRQIRFQGKEAKKLKQHINQERIYPPQSTDSEEIYAKGALQFKP